MYDAMGVRRQAGYHATAINNLVTAFPSDGNLRRPRDGAGGSANIDGREGLEAGLINGVGTSPGARARVARTRTRCWAAWASRSSRGSGFPRRAAGATPSGTHRAHARAGDGGWGFGVVVGTAYAFALRVSEGDAAPAA